MKKKLMGMVTLMIFVLGMPVIANANIVWPTLYIAQGMQSWYIILAGLAIEFLFAKLIAAFTLKKAALVAVVMNGISTVVGIILIPVVGLVGTIFLGVLGEVIPILGGGTFDVSQWIFGYILTILANVFVEGLSLKLIFKMEWKTFFWWLLSANTISVLLCVFAHGFTMDAFMR